MGGAVGLLFAAWSLPAVLALDPTTVTPFTHVTVDWRVQVVAFSLAMLVSLLAATLPVLAVARGDIARGLADGARRTAGSRRSRRVRSALVAAETLLAVVLVTCGAVLLRAFHQDARTNPGFDPHNVLGGQLRLSAIAYPTLDARAQFVAAVLERVRAEPGVLGASSTANLFQPGFAFITLVHIEGKLTPDGQPHSVQFRRISPQYFTTMRIPERRGRTFDDHDDAKALPVAVVSQLLADTYWPGEDPIGRRVQRVADLAHWLTVIGVVGDVSDVGYGQAPAATIYVAYAQNNVQTASVGLVVRTVGDARQASKRVARAIHEIDSAQPLSSVTTLDRFLDDSLGPERFRSVLLIVFAMIGLALAAVGIYGVASRGVTERTRELGVRLLLGSRPAEIRRLILWQASASVGTGFVGGLPMAWLSTRALSHWLPGIDRPSLGVATVALAALAVAGFVAVAAPALRAGRVNPLTALRAD
jgi:putative ABC transport system permease protein